MAAVKPEKKSYVNKWYFRGKPFETKDIKDFVGFVYEITNKKTGEKYIGRKYFYSYRKTPGKAKRTKTESNWKEYWGSSKKLLADMAKLGPSSFSRRIISLHKTQAWTNYSEAKEQFAANVLEDKGYYNENIGGKYHWITLYEVPDRTC